MTTSDRRPSRNCRIFGRRRREIKGKPTPKTISDEYFEAWLQKQDVYTLHRPVRKRFAHNPYAVWECDLLNVKAYENIMIIIYIFFQS